MLSKTGLQDFFDGVFAIKYSLLYFFIMSRSFEHGSHLLFIYWQHQYTVQDLHIVRDKYQRKERFVSKVYCWISSIICLPLFAFLFTRPLIRDGMQFAGLTAIRFGAYYSLMILYFVLVTYNCIFLKLVHAMRKYHRHEYETHYKRMAVLFLATEISLILTIVQQVYFLCMNICMDVFVHEFPPMEAHAQAWFDPFADKVDRGFCNHYFEMFIVGE